MTQALVTHEPGTLDQLRAVRNALAPDLNDQELQLFAMVAYRSGLDPFAKQIYAIKRQGRVTFQTGIDGYRSIAARTGEYDGQDEAEYGAVCGCQDLPKGHPEFATVRVHRKGMSRPVAATAYWHEYVPQQDNQAHMWRRMPRVMIAKVAEALALRKAFPWDPNRGIGIGADLYTADEMAQADRSQGATSSAPAPTAAQRVSQRRAAIESGPVAEPAVQPEAVEPPASTFLDDAPPPPAPMSQDELKARVKADEIDLIVAERVFHETFPKADSLGSLTDVQRGAYWAALEVAVG